MELKNRQASILKYILNNENSITIPSLMDTFNVSKRTIYYDLKKIDTWMKDTNAGGIVIIDKTVKADIQGNSAINKLSKKQDNYYLSIDERIVVEILLIALSKESVTIQMITDFLDVSRNTILSDLKKVKKYISSWNLSLVNSVKKGYEIIGDETRVRKLIDDIILGRKSEGYYEITKKILADTLFDFYKEEVDYLSLCENILWQMSLDTRSGDILSNVTDEALRIEVALIRSKKGNAYKMSADEEFILMELPAFRSMEIISEKTKIYGIVIPREEIFYIVSIFSGMRTSDAKEFVFENKVVSNVCTKLILDFERIGFLFLADREYLSRQMERHISSLYFRKKYSAEANNVLISDIKELYPFVFELTKKTIECSELEWIRTLSDDEIGFLTVYLASSLDEKRLSKSRISEPKKILIIGPNNVAEASMLRSQLRNLLGYQFEYTVISEKRLRTVQLDSFLLVICLKPLEKEISCDNLVNASAVLTDKTQREILKIIRKSPDFFVSNEQVSSVLKVVHKYMPISEMDYNLYFDLFRLFQNPLWNSDVISGGDFLFGKIERGDYMVQGSNSTWEDTFLEGAERLRPRDRRFFARMKNLVRTNRLHYYRPNKDVMVVQYPMQGEKGAFCDCVIFVSPSGIRCMDDLPAKIIVGVSTVDNYEHWDLLWQVYRYFNDDENSNNLIAKLMESKEEAV